MTRRIVTCLLLAALAFICLEANGQTTPQNSASLGLEIVFYPKQGPAYVAVKRSRGGAWFARFGHIPYWQQPADSLPVDAVNIACEAAESGVRVWVSVYLGKTHEQEKPITSYILHEGEKVTVQELSEVGVVPFEIKLVRLSGLISDPPKFVSKAKSIELVTMQQNLSTLPTYHVTVRNLLNKSVMALSLQTLQGERREISSLPRGKEGAVLIGPNGTYEFDARLAVRSTPTAGDYSPVVPANQIIEISAAVFEDGSFEGDSEPAVTLAVLRKGGKIQLERIVALLERCLAKDDADAFMNLEWLKSQVSALSIQADTTAVAEVANQLTGVPGNRANRIKTGIEVALTGTRNDALKEIGLVQIRSRHADAKEIRDWLTSTKERYAAWAGRL